MPEHAFPYGGASKHAPREGPRTERARYMGDHPSMLEMPTKHAPERGSRYEAHPISPAQTHMTVKTHTKTCCPLGLAL